MPFNNRFVDIGVEKRSKEESVRTQEEDSFSISINETWLSMADVGHVAIKDDEMLDLRTFWKGEGNARSIRKARGIYDIICTYILYVRVTSYDFSFLSLEIYNSC